MLLEEDQNEILLTPSHHLNFEMVMIKLYDTYHSYKYHYNKQSILHLVYSLLTIERMMKLDFAYPTDIHLLEIQFSSFSPSFKIMLINMY